MSRHWSQKEYINADSFWCLIDDLSNRLDILGQHDSVESSELCKLMLLGRREMLDSITTFVHENQMRLDEVLIDQGVMSKEEINKVIKEEYGV